MLRGINTAASGMIALQRKQNALTNNLANVETPGFKQDASPLRSFPEMLLQRINQGEGTGRAPRIGTLSMGVYNQETLPLFSQGSLVSTNMPFDVAINDQALAPVTANGKTTQPAAFFSVQTADGSIQFTRNGRFAVNGNGQLTTASGDLILGKNGRPIADTELSGGDISIQGNGEIVVHPGDAARARTIGSLGMVIVNNPHQLIKKDNGLYELDGANPAIQQRALPAGLQLHHKMIEQSNVDTSQTITDMMTNIRLYEANQKVLQTYDKTLEQLSTIGRV
ncbi:flagellar hook-basal body protein [Neobacillus kokaensis]|uniref:Flagellar hook-basal body complex protein FlhO n=1 Tax=Neobacillus kokaensis TaxID=2759023 RepID=A0ABQ3N5P4_9BACI|nr:flagellar hook-basal body protein [Neobacillus kokaensis]GHH99999.1 flagellar hook-basal body complex protein FlhO [Neobacillus kokaensis]